MRTVRDRIRSAILECAYEAGTPVKTWCEVHAVPYKLVTRWRDCDGVASSTLAKVAVATGRSADWLLGLED